MPGTWQTQGHGVPIDLNEGYPFMVDPPRVMSDPDPRYTSLKHRNPVESYETTFSIPKKVFMKCCHRFWGLAGRQSLCSMSRIMAI